MNSLLTYANFYKLFVTVFIIYCWVNYYVFKRNKSLPILLIISIMWLESTMNFVLENAFKSVSPVFLQGVLNVVYEIIIPGLVFYFYYRLLSIPIYKRLQIIIAVVYFVLLFNSLVIQNNSIGEFIYNDYLSVAISVILSIIVFFLNFMLGKEIVDPYTYLPFWISLALVIIYIGLMPVLYFGDGLSSNFFQWIYNTIFIVGEILLVIGIELYKKNSND